MQHNNGPNLDLQTDDGWADEARPRGGGRRIRNDEDDRRALALQLTRTTPERLERVRRLLDPSVSLERMYSELNRPHQDGAASSTCEAIAYALREGGVAALSRPANKERLAALSPKQVQELLARLIRERTKYQYPNITDELLDLIRELS